MRNMRINQKSRNGKAAGSYAPINGLHLYYEIHGTGQPLVLIHGGLGVIDMFAGLLPVLAETRQVIGVELQGHGHTADIDRPLSFELMADDIGALIRHLGFLKADIMGYSLGGGVALQTAIRHPVVARKLVLVSTPCKRDGWYPEVLAGMAGMNAEAAKAMEGSLMHTAYVNSAPNPEDFPKLVEKTRDLLGQDYDWSAEVAALKTPALIVAGDADSVRLAHLVEMFSLLGGGQADGGWDGSGMSNSRLAILPGTTHFTILNRASLLPIITMFLEEPPAPDPG
jgi:pimeloyl-ACP methyl ester carboxylesterase